MTKFMGSGQYKFLSFLVRYNLNTSSPMIPNSTKWLLAHVGRVVQLLPLIPGPFHHPPKKP